jgi:hypothetical protein
MVRQLVLIVVLLSVGLSGANGKEAKARNEDVPKGPATAAPAQGNTKPTGPQAPTGTVNGGDRNSTPSGDTSSGSGKSAAPVK